MVIHDKLKFLSMFCMLIPFMQVGYTYYLSVQLLLVIILLMNCSFRELKVVSLLFLFLCPIMVFPALIVSQGWEFPTLLLTLRECLVLSFILAIVIISRSYQGFKKEYIEYLLMFFLGVVFLQFVGLKSGELIALPSRFLSSNQGTLEGVEFALSLGISDITNLLRPSVFYGEPSFLSFVCISLFYIILTNDAFSDAEKKYYAVVVLFTFLLSQSMSGILALFIIFGAAKLKNINVKNVLLMLMGIILLLCVLVYFSDSRVVQRLLEIVSFDGSDASSMTRLIAPFTLISSVFQDYPFGGAARFLLIDLYGNDGVHGIDGHLNGIDNGLLNMFINYGYFGFVIWGIIITVFFRNPLGLVYIILASMFNGAFLAIDKLSMIGMAIILANSNVSQLMNQKRNVQKKYEDNLMKQGFGCMLLISIIYVS